MLSEQGSTQASPTEIYTVGHGNRSIPEFLEVLAAHRIACVVDVRAYPASRRHSHFSRAALQRHLCDAGIGYVWEGAALGGMRKSSRASPHIALNTGLRGFADHMASANFQGAVTNNLARLLGGTLIYDGHAQFSLL